MSENMRMPAAASWHRLAEIWSGQTSRLRQLYESPEAVQTDLLAKLISRNADSAFGADHRFAHVRSYKDYIAAVPVGTYEDHRPYIDRLAAGEPKQLTTEAALFVEMTGGSTGGSKVIPYTAAALDGYARALNPWLADLIERHPDVAQGRIYFSLSPAGRPPGASIGSLPLGSAEQFEYFGDAGTELAALSIAPSALSEFSDMEEWRFATCLHLLAASDLTLIWVWSPTYLSELIHAIRRMKSRLLEALAAGGPQGAPYPFPAPARAAAIAEFIEEDRIDTASIWPHLKVISCWMDASSTPFANELQRLFPRVFFQAKGLMATEGATTLPFGDGEGSPLAIESGFFEFANEQGAIARAWELQLGEVRRVIVSNWSGFYRYDTGDLVEVVGFEGATPRLRFIGRAGKTSDLCGEKLSEQFVLSCLDQALGEGGQYAFLAPVLGPQLHYELWIHGSFDQARLSAISTEMDTALGQNPQYAYARSLGQLQAIVAHGAPELYETYQNWAVSTGKNLGHLKAPALVQALPEDLRALLKSASA